MQRSRMVAVAYLAYGALCYGLFLLTLLLCAAFLGNWGLVKGIDSARTSSLTAAFWLNLMLLLLFAVQHSGMARPAFKRWWVRYVPRPIERSTYVLLSSLTLLGLVYYWQPMGGVIWQFTSPAIRGLAWTIFGAGWLIILLTSFLINHFELFGLQQVVQYWKGEEGQSLDFVTPGFYAYVRHPLYVGWLMVFWGTPTMTLAHLFFAMIATAYILIAVQWEERDLETAHGQRYIEYRRRVPMLIPRIGVRGDDCLTA